MAYTTDRDLHSTLLFDSLVDPSRTVGLRKGGNVELFGHSLAKHVEDVNLRVLVTGRPARVEVDIELRGPAAVVLAVEPVLGGDGEVVGLVGTVLDRRERPDAPALRAVSRWGEPLAGEPWTRSRGAHVARRSRACLP